MPHKPKTQCGSKPVFLLLAGEDKLRADRNAGFGRRLSHHHQTHLLTAKGSDMKNGNFGQAIEEMKAGRKVWREGWNGKGMWLILVEGQYALLRDGTPYDRALNTDTQGQSHVPINPHIDMFTADGKMQPGWLASQTDMLAEDWCSDRVY